VWPVRLIPQKVSPGLVVFVPNASLVEKLRVRVQHRPSASVAELNHNATTILPNRRKPPCILANDCVAAVFSTLEDQARRSGTDVGQETLAPHLAG